MKHCSRTLAKVWTLCIILSLVCVCVSEESTVSKERMHEIVKSMLGFKDIPNMPHPQNVAEDAPQYMMDLYERFKNGPISKGELNGNTVRSIKAKQVTVQGQTMFVFNLTSLVDTEQMISAEIHLYKRRKTRYNKKAELEIMLHEMAKHYSVDSGKITINPKSFGWQWFDVTNSVKSCLSPSLAVPHSLGLNFKMAKPHGHSNMLKLTRFMHHHSVPYLIIYSNDSQDIDLDEIDKIKKKEKEVLLHPEIDTKLDDVDTERTNRDKRSLNDNSADIPSYRTRARSLSILTNEIPEDPDDFRQYHPVDINIQTHPGMLQTRKESRHRLSDARLIPYPEEYVDSRKRRKWRNRRRKNQKGRRKNTLELPKKWEDLQHRSEDTKSKKLCGRKKLVIDFNDIGWGEWIISPKSFKAHYCSGSCPFPLTKNLRPSNHATMLSLVNAFGIYADVPAPCCVPEKLSSITLLYVDENNNVVLKNYPNMTVQKCGCR